MSLPLLLKFKADKRYFTLCVSLQPWHASELMGVLIGRIQIHELNPSALQRIGSMGKHGNGTRPQSAV
jgi:hypothetical protein